jgi:hypothetical protein
LRAGRGGVLVAPPLSSCPYSAECVEGQFSEIRTQDLAYNVARKPRGRPLGHLAVREWGLDVVVVHKEIRGCE